MEQPPQRALWVVGSPRSGTTLLRNLLNLHPDIALCSFESKFVPSLLSSYPGASAFADDRTRADALQRIATGRMYLKGQEDWKWAPSSDQIEKALQGTDWSEVVRELLDLWCDKDMSSARIWGDNTATYSEHIDTIAAAIPHSVFVQIIRDPRDRALSEKAIWHRSFTRSAHTWANRITRARASVAARDGNYYELTFEDLVTDPTPTMAALVAWLGLPPLNWSAEDVPVSDQLGQSIGLQRIDATAHFGRRSSLTPRAERRIAALSGRVAASVGYQLPDVAQRSLSRAQLWGYRQYDRAALSWYYLRSWGIRRAFAKIKATVRE